MSHVSVRSEEFVSLQGKTVVILDDPTVLGGKNLHRQRVLSGADVPAHTYALAPMTFRPIPIRYTRSDQSTLLVEFLAGYTWTFFRDRDAPFSPGEIIELDRLKIEILAVDDHGVPMTIRCRFDTVLEDPSFVWLTYEDLALWPLRLPYFAPRTPPKLGYSITLNEA